DAEAISELLEPDGAVEEVGHKREQGRRTGRSNDDVAADLAKRNEDPEERWRREKETHANEARAEKERRVRDEIGGLEEDRLELPWEIQQREEPVVEEHVALGEASVAVVEWRPPAQKVVAHVHGRDRDTSRDHEGEGPWKRGPRLTRAEEGESRRRERDRQAGESRDADQRSDHQRVPAARGDRERTREKEHRCRMRRVPGAAVHTGKEERRPERREERARERVGARRPVTPQPVIDDAGCRAAGDPRHDHLRDRG